MSRLIWHFYSKYFYWKTVCLISQTNIWYVKSQNWCLGGKAVLPLGLGGQPCCRDGIQNMLKTTNQPNQTKPNRTKPNWTKPTNQPTNLKKKIKKIKNKQTNKNTYNNKKKLKDCYQDRIIWTNFSWDILFSLGMDFSSRFPRAIEIFF